MISGANSAQLNTTEGGFYTVETTNADACNGAGISSPVFITVNALPTVLLSAIGNTTFCQGDNVTLLCNQGTGTIWSNGAIDVNSASINNTGDFSVNFTDANGCSNTSNTISVTVNTLPSVSIAANGPTTFCDGGSVTLTSSQNDNNSWTGGITTNSIDVSTSGIYELTYTDNNGCTATATTSVTVNDQPNADFTILQNNGSFIIQFLNNSTDATGYSWDFGDGQSSQENNPSHLYTTGGNFTVTLTASNGDCSDTFVFDVMNVSVSDYSNVVVGLYPNPADHSIQLQAPANSNLNIYDITGKMVLSVLTQNTTTTIDVSSLNSGLYFVKGYNNAGNFTLKFEKQ
jgi:PKD repeat protein